MLFRGSRTGRTWGVLVVCVVLLMAFSLMGRSKPAAKPDAFVHAVSLAEAVERSSRDGRAVLAFATADWCGPCQELKRGALADEGVSRWVRENVHAVYVDGTDDNPDVGRLRVFGFPTLVVLRGGREVSRLEGVRSAEEVRRWLAASTGPLADWKHANPGKEPPTGG
jgi:thiol:disulfide interchange protein